MLKAEAFIEETTREWLARSKPLFDLLRELDGRVPTPEAEFSLDEDTCFQVSWRDPKCWNLVILSMVQVSGGGFELDLLVSIPVVAPSLGMRNPTAADVEKYVLLIPKEG